MSRPLPWLAVTVFGFFGNAALAETVLQPPAHEGGLWSGDDAPVAVRVEATQDGLLRRIEWWGGYETIEREHVEQDQFRVRLLADDHGAPGKALEDLSVAAASRVATGDWVNPPDEDGFPGRREYHYAIVLQSPMAVRAAQPFWVSIENLAERRGRAHWLWEVGSGGIGRRRSPDGSWEPSSAVPAVLAEVLP